MSNSVRLAPTSTLEAAGYIRVSLERQAGGHSPGVQKEAIKRLAAQEGYALTMIEEDHERGSKVTRVGYQRIIEAVRAGTVQVVIVFMFDRWGRDGAEWLTRTREFERLGVPIISVQEGKDEGGIMRFVRAGMAEEYSRALAKRVRPNKEVGARSGTHMGKTPIGYVREYPKPEANGKRLPGELHIDETSAWIVRELFAKYAVGGYSIRGLVEWLNGEERIAPPKGKEYWTVASIKAMLHNPTYIGLVRYNHHPAGQYERAPEGSSFTVPGRHEPLIDAMTFEQVQKRMAAAALRQSYNRRSDSDRMGSGLFRCGQCGGPMRVSVKKGDIPYYECGWRQMGKPCTVRAYLTLLGHEALLAQICRLRGAPWTPQAERRLTGGDDHALQAAKLQRAIDQERETLRRHTRLMSTMVLDPTLEEIMTFREVSAEISGHIRALEAQIAAVGQRTAQVPDLRELHQRLTRTEIPAIVQLLRDQGDEEGLRDLVQGLITSAKIVERRPESHPTWLRAEVQWLPDIPLLVEAGLLRLDVLPEGPPPIAPKAERMPLYYRRYRERHRDEINAKRRTLRAGVRARHELEGG